MTIALYTHPDCNLHQWSKHPERPERLISVMERIESGGLGRQMQRVLANEASESQLQLAHPASFIRQIAESEPEQGLTRVEADTFMSPGSLRAARLAVGATVGATESVLDGTSARAFCAIRPPGHHAEIAQAMGFCLFNNIAIAAETALQHQAIKRVAILDFDVHHCNGTVDIFKDREEVLVCSSFQEDFYPFRYLEFSNEHIIRTPLAAGTRGLEFRKRIEQDWVPALLRHKPDFIFISAGFDAHENDPIGQLRLLEEDYLWVTRLIVDLCNDISKGRLVSTLEGGYDLAALASCVDAHLQVLIEG
jgi:acetoin utilization deacetylase AcuC-like enzyme